MVLRKPWSQRVVMLLVAGGLLACGSKKDDDDDDASTAPGTVTSNGSTVTNLSTLATAYPAGLGLTLFPTKTSSSLWLADAATAGDAAGKPLKAKKEEAEKMIKGQGDSCLPSTLAKQPPADGGERCYEFDQDMMYGFSGSQQASANGAQTGVNAKGEACLPAFARSKVDQIADMVERSTAMIQAMMCQAQKNDANVRLPEKGATVDLAAAMSTALGPKANKISKATITREATDAEDGSPIYTSSVEMTDVQGSTRIVSLVHSPAANGTDYTGVLINAVVKGGSALQGGAPNQDSLNKVHYVTVAYSNTKTTIEYELRAAQIHTDIENPFDAEGQLDFNAGADFSVAATDQKYGAYKKADGTYFAQANEAVAGMTYIVASNNADDNTGTFLYAQNPGGNFTESARGMVGSLSLDSAGVLGGCAISGAALGATNPFSSGMSIRRALKESPSDPTTPLTPKGFFHPFMNTAVNNGPGGQATVSSGTDQLGEYRTKSQGNQTVKWYLPTSKETALNKTFAEEQAGAIITRQCFDLKDGKYVIDTTDIPDTSGFQLVKTDTTVDTTILPPPPKPKDQPKLPNTPPK